MRPEVFCSVAAGYHAGHWVALVRLRAANDGSLRIEHGFKCPVFGRKVKGQLVSFLFVQARRNDIVPFQLKSRNKVKGRQSETEKNKMLENPQSVLVQSTEVQQSLKYM